MLPTSRVVLPRLLRTASFRLTSLYVAVFALSAMVLGAVVFLTARSALEQQMTARIETDMDYLRGEFRSGGRNWLVAIVQARGHGPIALDYLIQDQTGVHLAGEIPSVAGLQPGWSTIKIPQAPEDDGRPERTRVLVTDLGDGLLLGVGDDIGRIGEIEEAITTAFAWTVGLVAVLGIGGGAVLSRAFLTRVDAISRTAEAIIGGDLTQRISVRGTGDDLDRLAGTLNRMLDRIGALMDSLRQISTDVAHDLRTPLSRLYQRLEDARMHARSVAEYEAAVEGAVGEAEGLLATFSALLRIAQVEGASPHAGFADVDLSSLADAVADAYRPDAEDGGYQLVADVAAAVVIHGDRELLTQAVANLLENALRHTPPGTRVGITLRRDRTGEACLAVDDNGPGVGAADLSRLTNRFYRTEQSRTTPGNGLGLSLVAAVAALHEARLHLEPGQPGLRVAMCFAPVSPRRDADGPTA